MLDLLRALRNKEPLKICLAMLSSKGPGGYLKYWTNKFPRLADGLLRSCKSLRAGETYSRPGALKISVSRHLDDLIVFKDNASASYELTCSSSWSCVTKVTTPSTISHGLYILPFSGIMIA